MIFKKSFIKSFINHLKNYYTIFKLTMSKVKKCTKATNYIQLRGIDARTEIQNFFQNSDNKLINKTIVDCFSKIYLSKNIHIELNDKELNNKYANKNSVTLSNGTCIYKLTESNKKYVCYWDRQPFDWEPVHIHFEKIGRHPLNITIDNSKIQEFVYAYEFCSYECEYAYLQTKMKDEYNPFYENAYYYMQKNFSESYPNHKLMPANDPLLIIGNSSQGVISVEEFRKNLKKFIKLDLLHRQSSYMVYQVIDNF